MHAIMVVAGFGFFLLAAPSVFAADHKDKKVDYNDIEERCLRSTSPGCREVDPNFLKVAEAICPGKKFPYVDRSPVYKDYELQRVGKTFLADQGKIMEAHQCISGGIRSALERAEKNKPSSCTLASGTGTRRYVELHGPNGSVFHLAVNLNYEALLSTDRCQEQWTRRDYEASATKGESPGHCLSISAGGHRATGTYTSLVGSALFSDMAKLQDEIKNGIKEICQHKLHGEGNPSPPAESQAEAAR